MKTGFAHAVSRRQAMLGIGSLLMFFNGVSSHAGEVLRLKAGDLALEDQSEKILLRALSESDGVSSTLSQGSGFFIVQFRDRITMADHEALANRGIRVKAYLPDDALVVQAQSKDIALARTGMSDIRAVTPFYGEWKVSPELLGSKELEGGKPAVILVSAFDSADTREIASQLANLGGISVKYVGSDDLIIEAGISSLAQAANVEGISWMELLPKTESFVYEMDRSDFSPKKALAFTGHESGTKIMNFQAAWDRGFTGQGQIVAVADTGLDSGKVSTLHPDFVGNFNKGYLMGLGTNSWEDSMGHGTHVSGSVVGNGKASDEHLRGGAHGAQLMMEGMWSSILDNLAPVTDFNKLMGAPFADGARIHSNSWGASANFGAYDTFASKVDDFMWKNPDMLVLFAAGNSGEDADKDGHIDEGSVSSPGTAKNVLTVGASENLLTTGGIQKSLHELRDGEQKWGVEPLASDHLSDNADGMAAFSSRGPCKDGRLKPEIVAPGTNIVSTRSHHPKASPLWGEFNGDYVYAGGTSMATPLTAGAAAVVREYLIKEKRLTTPSAALLKAVLMHTAKDMYPGQYGSGPKQELPVKRPNNHEGYGRVDMDQATALGDNTLLVDDRSGVGLSEEKVINIPMNKSGSLRATLSYTDAPGAASAAKALVNDLDLRVVSPSGKVFELGDHKNNSEMLELSGLEAGEYKVVVKGMNVPTGRAGKQPYALVVSFN